MSTTTKPVWRTATGHKEDDFDAIWLYENAREWTFSEENGVVTLHYLSSKVMPKRKEASPVEKQFCRNCGKRDSAFSQEDTVHFWEPGMCMECHCLPVIGIRYDVFTGKRIEPRVQWDANRLKRLAGIPEHDGKLDAMGDKPYGAKIEFFDVHPPTALLLLSGGYGTSENAEVYIDPTQALSLLAWLEQEKGKLEKLAKEQAE